MQRAARQGAAQPRGRTLILTATAAMIVSGCVSPVFRETVGQFGTLTKTTTAAQNARLAAITANERERIRVGLAEQGAELRLDAGCGLLVPTDPANPRYTPCRLLTGGQPIPEAVRYESIAALSTALSNYGESLIALAADSTADQTAFANALGGMATSVSGLDTAIRKVAGASASTIGGPLGAVATLLGRLGNLYFAAERGRVLRQIIRDADPLVQRAVRLLTGADAGIDLYDRTNLFRQLREAESKVAELARDHAPASRMRVAQDTLVDRVAAYNTYSAGIRHFQAIGAAHTRLLEASREGLSAAELQAAFEAIIQVFNAADEAVTSLSGNAGGASDGN